MGQGLRGLIVYGRKEVCIHILSLLWVLFPLLPPSHLPSCVSCPNSTDLFLEPPPFPFLPHIILKYFPVPFAPHNILEVSGYRELKAKRGKTPQKEKGLLFLSTRKENLSIKGKLECAF